MEPYFQAGGITLYHQDCRDGMSNLKSSSVQAVLTDPPYGVDKSGLMLGQISANYHEKGTHSRGYADHSPGQYRLLMDQVMIEAHRLLEPGRIATMFSSNRTIHELAASAVRAKMVVLDTIVFTHGGTFAKSKTTLVPAYEPMLVCRAGNRNPFKMNPSRNLKNVIPASKGRSESKHPTTKPLAWMERVVDLASQEGDLVLDPFAGSGTTILAAAQKGRRVVAFEKDESYCEIAAQRLVKYQESNF